MPEGRRFQGAQAGEGGGQTGVRKGRGEEWSMKWSGSRGAEGGGFKMSGTHYPWKAINLH